MRPLLVIAGLVLSLGSALALSTVGTELHAASGAASYLLQALPSTGAGLAIAGYKVAIDRAKAPAFESKNPGAVGLEIARSLGTVLILVLFLKIASEAMLASGWKGFRSSESTIRSVFKFTKWANRHYLVGCATVLAEAWVVLALLNGCRTVAHLALAGSAMACRRLAAIFVLSSAPWLEPCSWLVACIVVGTIPWAIHWKPRFSFQSGFPSTEPPQPMK